MSDTLRATFRRVLRLENRRETLRPGRIERIADFSSAILGNSRQVTVYLPPGYDEHEDQRYPVLYMQDGQNLFDSERAYIPGQHWRLQEAADRAIGTRKAAPLIIVGIDNAGSARVDEYTPVRDRKHPGGGRAGEYGRMLIEELKPLIDERFRTHPEADATGIGGSSLGALVSLHLVLTRPDVFRRAIAMSPAVWWGGRGVIREVERYRGEAPRLWVDIGLREGSEALPDARLLDAAVRAKGWDESDYRYLEDRRGDHSERAWARRVPDALEFLFPPA